VLHKSQQATFLLNAAVARADVEMMTTVSTPMQAAKSTARQ